MYTYCFHLMPCIYLIWFANYLKRYKLKKGSEKFVGTLGFYRTNGIFSCALCYYLVRFTYYISTGLAPMGLYCSGLRVFFFNRNPKVVPISYPLSLWLRIICFHWLNNGLMVRVFLLYSVNKDIIRY